MDRRRFLKLAGGLIAAALHGGVPEVMIRPAVKVLDLDAEFAPTLMGLLVNSRLQVAQTFNVPECFEERDA